MKTSLRPTPVKDQTADERAALNAYSASAEAREKIASAQAEIDAGQGIVADEAYFGALRDRRAQLRAAR